MIRVWFDHCSKVVVAPQDAKDDEDLIFNGILSLWEDGRDYTLDVRSLCLNTKYYEFYFDTNINHENYFYFKDHILSLNPQDLSYLTQKHFMQFIKSCGSFNGVDFTIDIGQSISVKINSLEIN